MSDEIELGYLLAVAAAGVCAPRPLDSWFRALASPRDIVRHAKHGGVTPSAAEPLSSEVLRRLAALDDAAASAALARARACGAAVLTRRDERYPAALRERLVDAPHVLYYRGSPEALQGRSIAIVGSRAATPYGRHTAAAFARELGAYDAAIVSGFARGIDAAAHRGALDAAARTVAVLGCGLGALYPQYHAQLGEEILDAGGALISEFPPDQHALPHHFPMRNRIVAALAEATVVIEAGSKSGALITARLAVEYGRAVCAVPGDIGRKTSEGTNALIQDGVPLVTCAAEVAALVGWQTVQLSARPGEPVDELIAMLDRNGSAIDELSERGGLDAGTLAARLTMLEIAGLVERKAGGLFAPMRPPRTLLQR